MERVLLVFIIVCFMTSVLLKSNNEKEACLRSVDVAIVGAGPAGAYSAFRLRQERLRIEVFEYSNRVGGRLYTSTLPNAPDVLIELGGMRFIPKVHPIVTKFVEELGLTPQKFASNYGNTETCRYFLRGKSYTLQELVKGNNPYNLSAEEKTNQGRIFQYYLEKLTGFNSTTLDVTELMRLKALDGRYLYTIPINEALSSVATEEGKKFLFALDQFESDLAPDTSLSYLENNLAPYSGDYPVYLLKEGMTSLPQGMLKAFLATNPSLHKLTLNRKLMSIRGNAGQDYLMTFRKTLTKDDITTEQIDEEVICVKKIILAVPKMALNLIQWEALKEPRVRVAINAVREVKVIKIFLSFQTRWWMDHSSRPARVTYSDLNFSQFYDWGRSHKTGHYVMLASYTDESRAQFWGALNTGGTHVNCSVGGAHRVNRQVVETLLWEIARAYGVDARYIGWPVSAKVQFWDSYPFGGGWVVWRAGYHYNDVIPAVQRPSLTDDVFYVGADHAKGYRVGWIEGALETVDRVIDMYFK